MELRQLEHFVAVAEEGHFNRAALRCHIVQSGLSASIRTLERELNTRLFVRTTRDVRLTPAGLALLAEARRVLASADAARAAVSTAGGVIAGTLRVAVSHHNRAADVPAAIAAFHGAYPHVGISVTGGAWRDILADVRTGAIDVGLVYLPGQAPSGAGFVPLASGSPVVVCAYDDPLAARDEVDLGELRDRTIIVIHTGKVWRSAVDQALDSAGVAHPTIVEVTGFGMVIELARAGVGVGVMPGPDAGGASMRLVRHSDLNAWAAGDGLRPVCYVPITEPVPRWTYGLITPPAELRTPAANAFLELLTGHDTPLLPRSHTMVGPDEHRPR